MMSHIRPLPEQGRGRIAFLYEQVFFMRVAFIAPYSSGPIRGNITTINRISSSLASEGIETVTLAIDALSFTEMESRLAAFKPDLIHGFHAHHCGIITRNLAERFHVPFMITITGSDIHDRLLWNHPDTVKAIETAGAVVCFSDSDADRVTSSYPHISGYVTVVPQGVESLSTGEDDDFNFCDGAFILLLPAALRPVKCIEFPLQALRKLVQLEPALQLVIAGGVIDQDYAVTIRNTLSDTPFARWLGEVPHEKMGNLYHRADLVLNCSSSESMPNTLMEAMSLGRPVLASNIDGNRSLVRDKENGWLYNNEEEFRALVKQLMGDPAMREKAGKQAMQEIRDHFSPRLEAERYVSLYHGLVHKYGISYRDSTG